MAKKKTSYSKKDKEEKFSYKAALAELKAQGPQRLYLIRGPESYLAERFYEEIKKLCLTGDVNDFSYHKIDERSFSPRALRDAVDSMPFMSERSLVEVRYVDIDKISSDDTDEVCKILSDIPDYCTVVFIEMPEFSPDKRLKVYKTIAKLGKDIYVSEQGRDVLTRWIIRHFAAEGKGVELGAVERLITVSGEKMAQLLPEMTKVAAYAKGENVTVADVDAVATHIPEAVVFDMTEAMAKGENNAAVRLLSELLDDKNNVPYTILAVIGNQMRRLYAARIAIDNDLGTDYLKKTCDIKYDFIANKTMAFAQKFSTERVKRAVELCAETDYALKSTKTDPNELIKDCVVRICSGESNA